MLHLQKARAYLWLAFIFTVLTVGHALFFRFSFDSQNPYYITRGLAFGSALWSTALILAMVLRKGWARYILGALIVLVMLGFGLAILMMNSQSIDPLPEQTHEGVIGMVLYGVALCPLGLSRSLRRFLAPRTAGGR